MFGGKSVEGEENTEMVYEDKFIAFMDVLGFSEMVRQSESRNGKSLVELIDIQRRLGDNEEIQEQLKKYGPIYCPQSQRQSNDLKFEITQMSDSVIISNEVSPAGAINLISVCWGKVLSLMMTGVLCRGYISRGKIYHKGSVFIGTGFQETYPKEQGVSAFSRSPEDTGTPFVEIDQCVCEYIEKLDDQFVKKMIKRMVKSDDRGVTALYPFDSLEHSFILGDYNGHRFNPKEEKENNNSLRRWIELMRDSINTGTSEKTRMKAEHYINALDKKIKDSENLDKFLDGFCSSYTNK